MVATGSPTTTLYSGLGTITESGNDSWQTSDSSSYNLVAGYWQVVSGAGTDIGASLADFSDEANGAYITAVTGGSVSGSWTEDLTTHAGVNETVHWTLGSDEVWAKTSGTWSDNNSSL